MDKQKQIDEIAKDIVRSAGLGVYEKTEYLYDLGYRKIPENAVVLTREEYDELCRSIGVSREEVDRVVDMVEKDTRKETAEKFAERLKAMAYQSTDWSHGEHPIMVEVDYIDEICEEITEGKV